MGRVYERERGRAERNSRAPPAGMHGGSPPHRARHGQGCAVGSGEESELDLDLRRSAAVLPALGLCGVRRGRARAEEMVGGRMKQRRG